VLHLAYRCRRPAQQLRYFGRRTTLDDAEAKDLALDAIETIERRADRCPVETAPGDLLAACRARSAGDFPVPGRALALGPRAVPFDCSPTGEPHVRARSSMSGSHRDVNDADGRM
jgi:hypothetical protein